MPEAFCCSYCEDKKQNKWNRLKRQSIMAVDKKKPKKRQLLKEDGDAPFDNSPTVIRLLESLLSELRKANTGLQEINSTMKKTNAGIKEMAAPMKERNAGIKEIAALMKETNAGIKEMASLMQDLEIVFQ